MLFRIVNGFLVVAIFSFVFASHVYANGRNVGVRWEDTPLTANIKDAKGTEISLARAKVKKGEEITTKLDIRIGETEISVPLAKLKQVKFMETETEADPTDYLPAELVLYDGTKKKSEVKVMEAGKPLFLVGHTEFGQGEVALSKCIWIKFKLLDSEGSPTHLPSEMKAEE